MPAEKLPIPDQINYGYSSHASQLPGYSPVNPSRKP